MLRQNLARYDDKLKQLLSFSMSCFFLLQFPESAFEKQVVSKGCCFQLVEVMFLRLTKDALCAKTSKINSVFCQEKVESGKELAKALTV